jgi:hypothetical protein
MGFNTTVFLLNDRLDEIRRNPQAFVEEMLSAIATVGRVGRERDPWITGQTTVMPTAHADVHRLYMSHGNSMIDLSFPYFIKEEIRKNTDPQRREFLIKYYKDALKVARSLIRDMAKELKELEESEKKNPCKIAGLGL